MTAFPYEIDAHFCWRGQRERIHAGCVLQAESLTGRDLRLRTVKQVHGAEVLDDAAYRGPDQPADGLVTDMAGVALVIRTADCVPIHISDGRRIGLFHAGWRGTRDGILQMLSKYFEPKRTHVVVGPAITATHYEVDADLYEPWLQTEPDLESWLSTSPAGGSKRLLDLKGLVCAHFQRLGIPAEHITVVPVCTHASTLPSYRREGTAAGRIFNYIYRE